MISYNVITWEFNSDSIEFYDIMPYLYHKYEQLEKKLSFDELKEFIDKEARYMYWSRCEWEVIVTGWPQQKNTYKLDVYEQIKMNLDVIAELMWDDLQDIDLSLQVD